MAGGSLKLQELWHPGAHCFEEIGHAHTISSRGDLVEDGKVLSLVVSLVYPLALHLIGSDNA